jgi:tetratricopeptide (TPR) repeat protein
MVGGSFTKAWQKGMEEYREWSAKGKVDIVNTQKAWVLFKPATLPHTEQRPAKVAKDDIEAMFKDEIESLSRKRLANLSSEYIDLLKKKPNDIAALDQLGILYGENGHLAEALEQFQKVLAIDKDNPQALNNIGNINYLQERLEDAKIAYEGSLKSSPGDAGVMVNLSRVLHRMGKKTEAKKVLEEAASLDPRVVRRYGDIAASLGIGR